MKVFWFGDSWAAGSELAYTTSKYRGQLRDRLTSVDPFSVLYKNFSERNRPDLAFPALITEELNLDSYYYVVGGASIEQFYFFLFDCIKQFKVKDSIAIFALPTQWKRFQYISNDNQFCRHNKKDDIVKHELIHKVQLERGYYDTTILLNLLYHVCIANRITPYFFSCWQEVKIIESLNIIPKGNFLFPLSTTLVNLGWESSTVKMHNPDIYPNKGHPNIEGQKKLAKTLLPYVKNALLIK